MCYGCCVCRDMGYEYPKLWYAHVNDGKPVDFVEPHLEYKTMFRPIAYGVLKCV